MWSVRSVLYYKGIQEGTVSALVNKGYSNKFDNILKSTQKTGRMFLCFKEILFYTKYRLLIFKVSEKDFFQHPLLGLKNKGLYQYLATKKQKYVCHARDVRKT